jgi:hypothetical protein
MVAAPVDYFFIAKGVRLEPRKLDLLRFHKVSEQQAIHEILHSTLKVEGAAKLHANARAVAFAGHNSEIVSLRELPAETRH